MLQKHKVNTPTSIHGYRGVEKMQASVDLHSTKTKTCAHAKKSRNHTEARK